MSDSKEFTISLRMLSLGAGKKSVLRLALGASLLLGGVTAGLCQYARNPLRSVTGKVEDHGKEPLRGAVVQIEAEDTMTIESYVANEHGEYHFRNLRPDADYQIWATFRGHHSKKTEVSKFDKNVNREIEIEIDLDK